MVDAVTTSAVINELENLAYDILYLKRTILQRRPIIIEFCGTPKSGKTSCIASLKLFLKRNNFITKTLSEHAGICPITNKYDPTFNIWTMCSAISELVMLLSNHSKEYDVILLDRGIFDALIWLRWLYDTHKLDKETFRILNDFLSLRQWTSVIDLVYVFKVAPEISFQRECANLSSGKTSCIMRPDMLASYNAATIVALSEYQNKFRNIVTYDSSCEDLNMVHYNIIKHILLTLKNCNLDIIGYVKKAQLPKKPPKNMQYPTLFKDNIKLQFGLRSEVRKNNTYVQPIPIIVITNPERDKVLVVKKNKNISNKKAALKDTMLIYFGGDIRQEDYYNSQQNLLDIAHQTLIREVKDQLSIHLNLNNKIPHCIWLQDHKTCCKHLAMCFIYETDLNKLAEKFKLDNIANAQTKILNMLEIEHISFELDAWSKNILHHYFDIDLDRQSELFA